jgi:uncharacterized membrane protein YhaH (DUF805 family)
MGFGEAISSGFSNYVNFDGRAPRSEYWFWTLFVILVSIVAQVIDFMFGAPILAIVWALATFLPSLAVGARRLHDGNRTGWWLLLYLTVIGALLLLVWFCLKGTDGQNQYGQDPLA